MAHDATTAADAFIAALIFDAEIIRRKYRHQWCLPDDGEIHIERVPALCDVFSFECSRCCAPAVLRTKAIGLAPYECPVCGDLTRVVFI